MSLNTTPATWVTGTVVTAAQLNTEVRDAITGMQAAWSTWAPTLSQGATPNITKTVTVAKYHRVGKTIIGEVRLDITGAGTAGSAVTVTLPVTALYGGGLVVGSGIYVDVSAGWYKGVAFMNSTTTLVLYDTSSALGATAVGVAPNIATANGDAFLAEFKYEAA